jgi:hypothetical protein
VRPNPRPQKRVAPFRSVPLRSEKAKETKTQNTAPLTTQTPQLSENKP